MGPIPKIQSANIHILEGFMNILDIIILICLIPAIIQGIRKGFISQVISTVSLFIGIWLACKFATAIGSWMAGFINATPQALNITGFIIILVATCLALLLVCKILEKFIKIITLGWLNRLLGVIFAILKCILILGLVVYVFESINSSFDLVSKEYIADSSLYGAVKSIADTVFPYIKSILTNVTNE